ncbi:MAG: histidine phosphatase family protein [Clostridiales bacterium]|nr:histidine phosphatase family protein [Clostridiales bacterium]
MRTILYLVRHGETEWNKEYRFQGRTDIPLSKEGMIQAEKVGQRLKDKFDVIYTSPLTRAVQTAEIISKTSSMSPIIYDNLIEVDFGEWEGLTFEQVERDYAKEYKLWKTDENLGPILGGEQNMKNAAIRGKKALLDIVSKNKGKNIVVVAHGAIIKASLIGIFDLKVNMIQHITLTNTSITTLEFSGDDNEKPLIRGLNDRWHLKI